MMEVVHLVITVMAMCCLGVTLAQRTGAIRLVGGSDSSNGRLEVYKNNRWGTVNDDMWSVYGATNAKVVCRILGYTDLAMSTYHDFAAFGEGTGPIHMDWVSCLGAETNFMDCSHNPPDMWDTHAEDVGVSCFCDPSPQCTIPEEQCPHYRTEIVTVPHQTCPICRCASCPTRPKCPTNCKSGQTETYQGETCKRCRCKPQELPEFIEEPNDISLGMMVGGVVVMLVIPIVVLVIVVYVKRRRAREAAAKAKAAKKAAQEAEKENNWFADPAQIKL